MTAERTAPSSQERGGSRRRMRRLTSDRRTLPIRPAHARVIAAFSRPPHRPRRRPRPQTGPSPEPDLAQPNLAACVKLRISAHLASGS